MYSFVVLGLIPGTNYQITFLWWLSVSGLILSGFVWRWLATRHAFLKVRVILALYLMTLRPLKA
jgi:hypothetical protein